MNGTCEKMMLDWKSLPNYIRDVVEYTFIDKAEVMPGIKAAGWKLLSNLDWFFKIHFPGDPMMPGVLVMESIQQTGGLIINTMPGKQGVKLLFIGCDSMRMYKSVRPGDILESHVTIQSYHHGVARFHGESQVGGNLVCEMNFTLAVEDELIGIQRDVHVGGGILRKQFRNRRMQSNNSCGILCFIQNGECLCLK